MQPPGQQRQRPQLAVGQFARPGHRPHRHLADPQRRRQLEGELGAAARLDPERHRRDRRGIEPELRQQALLGLRVEDVERQAAAELLLAGVVDQHPDRRPVALAQEARQIGPHQQLLDRARLAGRRAAGEIAGQGVNPDRPLGDRIGHRELEGHRAVVAQHQVRLPEGGLGKVAAQLGRRSGGLRLVRLRIGDRHHPRGHLRARHDVGGRHLFEPHRRRLGRAHRPHPHHLHRPADPHAGPADAVAGEEDQLIAAQPGIVRQLVPAVLSRPDLAAGAEVGLHRSGSAAHRVESRHLGRLVGGEEIQAAVVHVGQQLGGAAGQRLLAGAAHRHPPGLAVARAQAVAEGGERDLQPAIVPGHVDRLGEPQQLVVAQRGQPHAETAAVLLGHRDLDDLQAGRRAQPPALDALAAAQQLEDHLLPVQPAVHQQPDRLAHRHRSALGDQHRRQRQRRRLGLGDDQLELRREERAPRIAGLVAHPVGARRQRRQRQLRLPVVAVRELAAQQLAAVGPARQHGGRQQPRVPARPQPVAGGAVAARRAARDNGLLGRQQRPVGLRQLEQSPGARAGPRRPVEVDAAHPQPARLAGGDKAPVELDTRLDGDEAEPEDALGRAGLAPLVGYVDAQPVAVGNPVRHPALIRLGREVDRQLAVGGQLAGAGGDRLRRRRRRRPPPAPGRPDRLAGHPPGELAAGDRQPEVVARLAGEPRRPVEPQRLGGLGDLHLEGRSLVLLHPDHRAAAGRNLQTPGPQQPAVRQAEAARRRAEVVGGRLGGLHQLAVGVAQLDPEGAPAGDLVAALVEAAAVDHRLPQHLLPRPVDAAVGVDESRVAGPLGRPSAQVEIARVDGDLVAAEGDGEVRALARPPRSRRCPRRRSAGWPSAGGRGASRSGRASPRPRRPRRRCRRRAR